MVAAMVFMPSCSSAPPMGPEAAKSLIEESAAAMGGWENLNAVTAQEILTGGADWEPMQAMEPGADARQVNNFGQALLVDFARSSMRLNFDAQRSYPTVQPVRFLEIIDGDAGMLQTADPAGKLVSERLHPSRLAARKRDLNRMPARLLKVARDAADLARVEDIVSGNQRTHVLRYKDSGQDVELQIDSFSKRPVRVLYTEDDPIYGDTKNELVFDNWKETGVIRMPHSYAWFVNGQKIREERVRTFINNPKYDPASFSIPDDVRNTPENGDRVVSQWTLRRAVMGVGYNDFARPQTVELAELARGVFHAKGSSHHSLVVEMSDHVVVVEIPLYEERSQAVIKAIEERFPNKPIKYAVITHFHIDHSGGMRAYAAKGATILAHESIVPFVNQVLKAPKTVRPDALAKASGGEPKVEGVKDLRELTDGARKIELRAVPNRHASAMLAAYLPAERLIFVSDLYSPGPNPPAPNDANALAFYQAVTDQNLVVERIAGGHGAVGPWRDLARVMATAGKTQ